MDKKTTIIDMLETSYWPRTLEIHKMYRRLHDDCDGSQLGLLSVMFCPDGDAWVDIIGTRDGLRFSPHCSGGMSRRTHTATADPGGGDPARQRGNTPVDAAGNSAAKNNHKVFFSNIRSQIPAGR